MMMLSSVLEINELLKKILHTYKVSACSSTEDLLQNAVLVTGLSNYYLDPLDIVVCVGDTRDVKHEFVFDKHGLRLVFTVDQGADPIDYVPYRHLIWDAEHEALLVSKVWEKKCDCAYCLSKSL